MTTERTLQDTNEATIGMAVIVRGEVVARKAEPSEIQILQNQIGEWSDSTFGFKRPPIAPLAHLVKELSELIECPTDRMEYADCMMLLLDAYRMAGGSADDLVTACYQKLEINKLREWGEPDEHGVVEHIREKQ